ncbi:4-coumarate--CoA ligase 4 [Aplysia californica]|uniref:4-coumarate--CoA ligase 4 n=1 Tax=Aplysia californica TaxID=6500 RepID=A0ABM0ZVH5_APLCA|nr:4-coumarate--CoA ligase 4 [Aplysia californica]
MARHVQIVTGRCQVYHSGPRIQLPEFTTLTKFLFEQASGYSRRTALHNKVAVVDGVTGTSTTYEELQEQVDHVTQNLHKLGLRHNDVLTLFGSNRAEFVHVLCACANLGVTVSLANSQLPTSELIAQLKLSSSCLVVTTPECSPVAVHASDQLGLRNPVVIGQAHGCVPFTSLTKAPTVRVQLPTGRDPNEVALLPFSSGTTGLPKGVRLSHRNLCAELSALRHPSYLPMTSPDSTSVCALPMVHIAGLVIGALNPLSQGACVVILPKYTLQSFLGAIQQHKPCTEDEL